MKRSIEKKNQRRLAKCAVLKGKEGPRRQRLRGEADEAALTKEVAEPGETKGGSSKFITSSLPKTSKKQKASTGSKAEKIRES